MILKTFTFLDNCDIIYFKNRVGIMKKDGFIATSLIYSFFLVFVAVLAALINGYVANKTIQERFNEDIADSLNNVTSSLKVYSYNSELPEGTVLENLLLYSGFSVSSDLNNTSWDKIGGTSFTSSNGGVMFSNIKTNSYLSQNVEAMVAGHQYYIAIDFYQTSDIALKTYFYDPAYSVETSGIEPNWTRKSTIITAPTSSLNVPFRIGESSTDQSGSVYFKNAMVIDLTESFGKGQEPDTAWLDENVDFVDGRLGFIKIDNIQSSSACDFSADNGDACIKVMVRPYAAFTNPMEDGATDRFRPIMKCPLGVESSMKVHQKINSREYYTFWIKPTFKTDTVCSITWEEI